MSGPGPLDRLHYHVSGAVERGEAEPIVGIDYLPEDCRMYGHEWDLDRDPASDYSCLHCGTTISPTGEDSK